MRRLRVGHTQTSHKVETVFQNARGFIYIVAVAVKIKLPTICKAWPVKNTDIDVTFSYLASCVLNVHVVLSVDLFPLALYWSLVNFVQIVVLLVLFVLVTAACGRWSPCYSTKLRQ